MRALLGRAVPLLVLAAVVVALASAVAFRVGGGRWERVETPSMGTAAPVGSLLWVRPVAFDDLARGDVVTFHPPGRPDVTYSHRVHKVRANGAVRTKGDISNVDPWTLHEGDVVGRVDRIWPGVGRLVEAAPVLAVGGVVVWGLVLVSRRRARLPVAVVGASLVAAAAVLVYQPFLQAEQLTMRPTPRGTVVEYVSTGLLPLRIAADGQHLDLSSGQTGHLLATGDAGLALSAHAPLWFWVLLVAACFAPAVWTTVRGLPAGPAHSASEPAAGEDDVVLVPVQDVAPVRVDVPHVVRL